MQIWVIGTKTTHCLSCRFWNLVAKRGEDECWPWLGTRYPKGYGHLKVDKEEVYAHRVAWELTNNKSAGSSDVMHSCDNPPCCNPKHLSLGTRSQNIRDAYARGRR